MRPCMKEKEKTAALHRPSHATREFRVDSQSGIRPIDPVFLHCKIESLQGGVGC